MPYSRSHRITDENTSPSFHSFCLGPRANTGVLMTNEPFKRFLKKHSIIVGIVVDVQSGSIEIYGNTKRLESDGLLHYYFTDAAKLNDYLTDRILPTMLQHGKVAGVISKPVNDAIVGLLYHDERPVLQRYEHSILLDKSIRDLWSDNSGTT